MEKQYLSIILRNQFNLFYRFSYVFIPTSELIKIVESVESPDTKENILQKFETLTPFEYDEEYVILHLKKTKVAPDEATTTTAFDIQDVVAIYPLSLQAKGSIKSKIDQRIRLEQPIFEDILPKIETRIQEKQVEKGVAAIWKIFKMDGNVEEYKERIGLKNILAGLSYRANGTKANTIEGANYWSYLIAYDRHDYFPNGTLGYFYDAVQVSVYSWSSSGNWKEQSRIGQCLEEIGKANPQNNNKIKHIANELGKNENAKDYIEKIKGEDKIENKHIIAPLYLYMRNDFDKKDVKTTTSYKGIESLKKEYDEELKYAIVLLGAFFGFQKFYDEYYNELNLSFYTQNSNKTESTKPNNSQKNLLPNNKENEPSPNETESPPVQPNIENDGKNEPIKSNSAQKLPTAKTTKEWFGESDIHAATVHILEILKRKGGKMKIKDMRDEFSSNSILKKECNSNRKFITFVEKHLKDKVKCNTHYVELISQQ